MEDIVATNSFSAGRVLQGNGSSFPALVRGLEKGRPVVLLHGFPQEPATWGVVSEALAQDGFYTVAPFQRGYVEATRPKGNQGFTFREVVADVLAVADALHLERFDVVGFGVGGVQAWMLAASHPSRIRSLTSIRFPHPAAFAGAMLSDTEQHQKWLHVQRELGAEDPGAKARAMLADDAAGLRDFLTSHGLPQSFLSRYVSRLSEPGAFEGALSWNQAISLEEFLNVPPVTVATLLVWSEGPALARAAAEASRSYVHAPFVIATVPGCSHFLLETASEALIGPLREHLAVT
jgi:pimeloyl-ACP methyl ester carboxylesterase